ncbi:MAG: hypothetical protein EOO88_58620 [Pedobacter sp.]|nr:MAG: hypothetical protein EOO88_58620 [Pedobacter sp.]
MKTQTNTEKDHPVTFFKLSMRLLLFQRRLADYLNIKCGSLSSRAVLALLITFSAAVSAYLLRLIINAIT